MALGNRGMTVEAARQCAKDRKEWRALVHLESPGSPKSGEPFLLGTVFFLTALPCSGVYHMERGGINCIKGATTENQGSGVKYMGQGVYLDDCVCFYLT